MTHKESTIILTLSQIFPSDQKDSELSIRAGFHANALIILMSVRAFRGFPHNRVLSYCLNFHLLKFMKDVINRIQYRFGMSKIELDVNNSERNICKWQQQNMILQRDEMNVNVNVRVNRMRNWLSKLGETINENLTRCLQWYVVVGCEIKQKIYSIL
jgi:hypothetical protein